MTFSAQIISPRPYPSSPGKHQLTRKGLSTEQAERITVTAHI